MKASTTEPPNNIVSGVDVGGTFTDIVSFGHNRLKLAKVLTTSDDPSRAMLQGLEIVSSEGKLTEINTLIHATTLVSNALIERNGTITGVITTMGFRDVLEIGREQRYDLFDLHIEKQAPLVDRFRRHEVSERIRSDGSIHTPLNKTELLKAAAKLSGAGCNSAAICFLPSYVNPIHEEQAEKILNESFPELDVSISSKIVPEIGEYTRMSSTVANAYVQLLVSHYLKSLEEELALRAFSGRFLLMLSNGGIVSTSMATRIPIQLIESGPAAGVIASASIGKRCGLPDLVSFDMGGTTAKICLVVNGSPSISNEFEAARLQRFKRGSGIPLRLSTIDLMEIGAGGGSIAQIDRLGFIKVGPESAGSKPGPACYNLGGKRPTVTDADLILGYLDPDFFLGGDMKLVVEAAENAITNHIAIPLGIKLVEAAQGIVDIINNNMATAIRLHVLEKGQDPQNFALIAFGGAGPVHANDIARRAGISRVLCPPYAGVASALGLLIAKPAAEASRSKFIIIDQFDERKILELLRELEDEAHEKLFEMGFLGPSQVHREVEMRYTGQGYQITSNIPEGLLKQGLFAKGLRKIFAKAYQATYGKELLGDWSIEALTWRVRVESDSTITSDMDLGFQTTSIKSHKGNRPAYFRELDCFVDCPVYNRYSLGANIEINGPAIIEEKESTIIVGPHSLAKVDKMSNIIIEVAVNNVSINSQSN